MKYKNLFLGVILVFIGILSLLDNFNVIYFSWSQLWKLWPVILILWGISVLPVKESVKLTAVVLTLAFSLFYIYNQAVDHPFESRHNHWSRFDDDDDTVQDTALSNHDTVEDAQQQFLIPMPENIKTAHLELDAVAGHFTLEHPTSNLTTFYVDDPYLAKKYTYYVKTVDDHAKVNITKKKHENINLKGRQAEAELKLNVKPVWEVEINAGAAELDMDFSKYKVKKLDVDAGAADIDITIGEKWPRVDVDIDAGAAQITLRLPKKADCVIDVDTFLSNNELAGFVKRNGKYYSENEGEGKVKINVVIDSAISELNIVRY